MKKVLVLGAGGFIGSNLVNRLKAQGCFIRGVDIREPEFEPSRADQFIIADLRQYDRVEAVCRLTDDLRYSYKRPPFSELDSFDEVYQLAADMGGAGYIFTGAHDAAIMHNSAQINLNVLEVLAQQKYAGKVFYSSSACMYPQELQVDESNFYEGLRESDAYPANPDSEYGWEKLFSERMYFAYARNYGLNVKVARFHNIYGPLTAYDGGKEKAPAAICRKVIQAVIHKRSRLTFVPYSIEIWGDGLQARSFLEIDDCLDGIQALMQSNFSGPVNIGSSEMVTINQLAEMAIKISGHQISITHIPGPIGVRGRNSNNEVAETELKWKPKKSLSDGLIRLYNWIESQIK